MAFPDTGGDGPEINGMKERKFPVFDFPDHEHMGSRLLMDFRGKVAVITGAASGIGLALALQLVGNGCIPHFDQTGCGGPRWTATR